MDSVFDTRMMSWFKSRGEEELNQVIDGEARAHGLWFYLWTYFGGVTLNRIHGGYQRTGNRPTMWVSPHSDYDQRGNTMTKGDYEENIHVHSQIRLADRYSFREDKRCTRPRAYEMITHLREAVWKSVEQLGVSVVGRFVGKHLQHAIPCESCTSKRFHFLYSQLTK